MGVDLSTSSGLLTALLRAATFAAAIFAALVAMQLYNLLKAGDVAQAWKSFIVGALVFAVWALTAFANTFFGFLFESGRSIALVMDLLQTVFVLLFAMGLWQQRQLFYRPDRLRPVRQALEDAADDDEDAAKAPSEAA